MMRRYKYSESGSVSIYLIIILTAIFFLNAVLIDYARILAANNQADKANKAALRSVFSAYDTELYESYGLFGLTNNLQEELYLEALNKNLYKPHDGFSFIDLRLDETSVTLSKDRNLADYKVYEQQILEEMKYIAPITLTEEVIDSFTSFSPVMNEATKTTKALNDVYKLYEERQRLLNEAVKYQQDATELYNQLNSFDSFGAYINEYGEYVNNLKQYNEIVDGEDYPDKTQDLLRLDDKIKSYQESARTSSLFYNSLNSSKHQSYLTNAIEDVERAKELNSEIKKVINEAEAQSVKDSQFGQLNQLTNSLNDIVMDEQFFYDFDNDLEKQLAIYNNILSEIKTLSNITTKALKIDIDSSHSTILVNQYKTDMLSNLNEIKEYDKTYQKSLFADSNHERERTLENLDSKLDRKELADNKKDSKNNLEELNQYYQLIKKLSSKQEEVMVVDQYYKDYKAYNLATISPNLNPSVVGEPEDVTLEAMTNFNNLLLSLPSLLESTTTDLYINEYVLSSFNSFDLTTLKAEDTEELIETLDINSQEVEYIIYGSNNLGGNLTNALTDIFLIRLAVRTTEGLFKFKGHPLAVFIEAITYGIALAVEDVFTLIDGKNLEFSTFTKEFAIDYDGYLRLLLLVHRNKIDRLARSQAIITFNTGKNLADIPTYIEARNTTTIRLWFLPGVMQSLDKVGFLNGKVEGNRYKIKKKVVFSY